MSWLQAVVLALVQGLTEFLPVSSSGYLILVPALPGWPNWGLTVDVAAHLGTLGAVVVYFWRDLWRMLVGVVRLVGSGRDSHGRRDPNGLLAVYIIVGTIPALIAGFLDSGDRRRPS